MPLRIAARREADEVVDVGAAAAGGGAASKRHAVQLRRGRLRRGAADEIGRLVLST